jgi:hypothetical protein
MTTVLEDALPGRHHHILAAAAAVTGGIWAIRHADTLPLVATRVARWGFVASVNVVRAVLAALGRVAPGCLSARGGQDSLPLDRPNLVRSSITASGVPASAVLSCRGASRCSAPATDQCAAVAGPSPGRQISMRSAASFMQSHFQFGALKNHPTRSVITENSTGTYISITL